MGNKTPHDYICLNENDSKFLEETHLEDLLDVEGRTNVPVRTGNTRKSIEHHLERKRLKQQIVDFDLYDEH